LEAVARDGKYTIVVARCFLFPREFGVRMFYDFQVDPWISHFSIGITACSFF
jgi:hypothetical protein